MTQEGMTALAREYAEWVTEAEGDDNAYIPAETAIASVLLQWLSRRYCLVEKEVVRTAYQQAMERGKHAHVKCQVESRAQLRLLERIFPEIAKEVE